MSTGCILLAAGGSSRLGGESKQMLLYEGRTLLGRAAATALKSICRPVVIVLGCQARRCRPEIEGLPVHIVEAPDWAAGMGASLKAGVRGLLESPEAGGVTAAIVMLCDQPHVSAANLTRMALLHEVEGFMVIASEYDEGGPLGPPALFARECFEEILALPDEEGAKALLVRYGETLKRINLPLGAWDVDTVEDYQRLCKGSGIADKPGESQ